jgi:hypothetical protein
VGLGGHSMTLLIRPHSVTFTASWVYTENEVEELHVSFPNYYYYYYYYYYYCYSARTLTYLEPGTFSSVILYNML